MGFIYVMRVKVVPLDIFNLLTPVALAHWIMGDGTWHSYGLRLCTDSFSISDVVRLMNVLIIKFQLDCTLQMYRGKYPRIYIRATSMPLLRSIIKEHMDPSMLYKIGLELIYQDF
jgi:hypothetical protein